MASALFPVAKAMFLGTGTRIDLDSDTIKVRAFTAADYIYDPTDATMGDVGVGTYSALDTTVGTVTVTSGVMHANNTTLSTVPASGAITKLVLYKFVSNDAGSTPIVYLDGFSVTPNGGDITIKWNNGATAGDIFSL